ncbi:hypothetical protein J2W32_005848 [Variovorax boronicumulans]|jgi:hypothetical protein|uniref:DUF4150 domain-containing protein n=1 Tax=Variovorax boronicumulans TaxID=436515 RepID=A0AAW8D7P1_9BURK|nr:PAAR-like domain-containing protein [Variovorax boronicumulans]MDP9896738.1 hypothetical protein [Variovorax boronicumulans]MDQ0056779.1 hypothetical protein [Variovorax boronicumulans]
MGNQVYANEMEVSCKAADGKSLCAFPDSCFTPPLTPATPPGTPLPYPNTGLASDSSDGSTTVKISGQEVMLKNKSYFKRSSGDEAGCAPKKGVVTSTNMGKVYFNAWSMDVLIEGENVVRHLDLMTHNHGSVPGNTATWPYLDAMTGPQQEKACGDEMAEVKTQCPNCENNKHADEDCPPLYANASKNKGYKDDPCVKAKRCMLVPYSKQNNKKGGCCPGQTAHHIVPKHHFPASEFPGYDQGAAPCVCAEGHSWHRNCEAPFNKADKTHPQMHDIQDAAERECIDIVEQNIAAGEDVGRRTADHACNYDEVRDQGIDAHHQCFPNDDPACSDKCLAAQINAYHRQQSVGIRDGTLVHTKPVGAADD